MADGEEFRELIREEAEELAQEEQAEAQAERRQRQTELEQQQRQQELEREIQQAYEEKGLVFAALRRRIPADVRVKYFAPHRASGLRKALEVRMAERGWALEEYVEESGSPADRSYESWPEGIALMTNGDVVVYGARDDQRVKQGRLLMADAPDQFEPPHEYVHKVRRALAHAVAERNLDIGQS